MKIIPADASGIQEAAQVLERGGLVVHATETCYGIAANMLDPDAVARLFAVKKRPAHMPVSALFPDVAAAEQATELAGLAQQLAAKHLPGPLTIIVPVRPGLALYATPGEPAPTVGVRVSPHPTALALARACAFPISTTSANLHGEPEAYGVDEIREQYKGEEAAPDLVLDDGALDRAPPSTVVAINDNKIRLVREGSIRLQ